ncbi:SDR family oxidoreductase [Microvenator marinus]|jgi:UDP-glucose 4-epimerase|uniref:SDR family oxidoreductase n=1 Tax=Microvenator marinus TaxID=2600177 RepID=A0A5B8XMN0_9DELT|nr:SDR family oxidoreductase [Microvenator marinus]QED26377.1 SDR family oxidoreductase [Microvenator marinus]
MKVLITGISGKIGRMVAERVLKSGHKVVGIDRRPWPDAPKGVKIFDADIRKRSAEEVVRKQKPDAIVHMATVTHLTALVTEDRQRVNLEGTRAIFDFAHEYGVGHVVFVGRHTYYGAGPDAPLYHNEDEPPVGVMTFPELADLVASDLYAGSALWRYPEMNTTVLRCVYTLGPSRHGTLASFLRGQKVPTILGYDPLFHFMHEFDVASAVCAALEHSPRGVFNVAGPQPVPLSLMIRVTGRNQFPIPESLFTRLTGKFGLPSLPPGAIAHIKYPIVIDGSRFKEATGFEHQWDEIQAMEAFRWS